MHFYYIACDFKENANATAKQNLNPSKRKIAFQILYSYASEKMCKVIMDEYRKENCQWHVRVQNSSEFLAF